MDQVFKFKVRKSYEFRKFEKKYGKIGNWYRDNDSKWGFLYYTNKVLVSGGYIHIDNLNRNRVLDSKTLSFREIMSLKV